MAVWTVYLSLCLLVALSASVETTPVGNKRCGVCRAGWSAFGCRCFKFFNSPQMWIEAEKICLNFDGNLASVHTHEEYMFIQNLAQGAPTTWLGGNDAVQEGVWLWSDGTKMDYQIWVPGQPDNYEGNEDCLEITYANLHFPGKWNDDNCSRKRPFVCVN